MASVWREIITRDATGEPSAGFAARGYRNTPLGRTGKVNGEWKSETEHWEPGIRAILSAESAERMATQRRLCIREAASPGLPRLNAQTVIRFPIQSRRFRRR